MPLALFTREPLTVVLWSSLDCIPLVQWYGPMGRALRQTKLLGCLASIRGLPSSLTSSMLALMYWVLLPWQKVSSDSVVILLFCRGSRLEDRCWLVKTFLFCFLQYAFACTCIYTLKCFVRWKIHICLNIIAVWAKVVNRHIGAQCGDSLEVVGLPPARYCQGRGTPSWWVSEKRDLMFCLHTTGYFR